MSTYDFFYRIAADLVYTSNSFSVIFYNEDFTRVQSIQPITTKRFRILKMTSTISFSASGGIMTGKPIRCLIRMSYT